MSDGVPSDEELVETDAGDFKATLVELSFDHRLLRNLFAEDVGMVMSHDTALDTMGATGILTDYTYPP